MVRCRRPVRWAGRSWLVVVERVPAGPDVCQTGIPTVGGVVDSPQVWAPTSCSCTGSAFAASAVARVEPAALLEVLLIMKLTLSGCSDDLTQDCFAWSIFRARWSPCAGHSQLGGLHHRPELSSTTMTSAEPFSSSTSRGSGLRVAGTPRAEVPVAREAQGEPPPARRSGRARGEGESASSHVFLLPHGHSPSRAGTAPKDALRFGVPPEHSARASRRGRSRNLDTGVVVLAHGRAPFWPGSRPRTARVAGPSASDRREIGSPAPRTACRERAERRRLGPRWRSTRPRR